jgi:hypothetical protein
MKRITVTCALLALLFACLPAAAGTLKVSTRPGDAILGGSAGLSSVRLDAGDDRVRIIHLAVRGSYFVSERWAIGAGAFYDWVDHSNIEASVERYLAEVLLVPVPDAVVSPFIRLGGGYSRWEWAPEAMLTEGSTWGTVYDAYTAEGAVGIFAFVNEYFAVSVDFTYFYDQLIDNPDSEYENNIMATVGFVGFLR